MYAAIFGDNEILEKVLLERGCDIHAVDNVSICLFELSFLLSFERESLFVFFLCLGWLDCSSLCSLQQPHISIKGFTHKGSSN